ncbi:MAG TPA: hypothetical protein VLH56_08520 [Dissulfurispiraceae bacterium]|nr:hypothetical protein [Dissulfurispiraceae bacterium]
MTVLPSRNVRAQDDSLLSKAVLGEVRKLIYVRAPNDRYPLGRLSHKAKAKEAGDYRIYWGEYTKPVMQGSFTAGQIFTDVAATQAYVAAASPVGTVVYVRMSDALASEFIPHSHVLLCRTDNYLFNKTLEVLSVHIGGTNNSVVGMRLLEVGSLANPLTQCNFIKNIGTVFGDVANRPDIIARDAEEYEQFLQIERTTYGVSERKMKQKLRMSITGDPLEDERRKAMWDHMLKLERKFLNATKSRTMEEGHPKTTCDGLLTMAYKYGQVRQLHRMPRYKGAWSAYGKKAMSDTLAETSLYGPRDVLGLCGAGALAALSEAAEDWGNVSLNPGKSAWGLDVNKWVHPSRTINLLSYAEFTADPLLFNSILLLNEEELEYWYYEDTHYRPDPRRLRRSGGHVSITQYVEEWFTDAALVHVSPKDLVVLHGVGLLSETP